MFSNLSCDMLNHELPSLFLVSIEKNQNPVGCFGANSGANPAHYTEVCFASFFSGGFTTMAVINPPERKLAKGTSVHYLKNEPKGLNWQIEGVSNLHFS